jgi:hypothetical protein
MAGLICIAWLISGISVALSWNHTARASSCLTTNYFRDNMFLTAAVIASAGNPNVSNTSVNGSGCNIGVYYPAGVTGSVNNVEIFGANYYGVVNNGGNAQITNSRIHDIGENPLNGDQHGVYLSNLDGTYPSCIPTLTPTNIVVTKNIITYDEIENTTGFSPTAGYQAGISDQGDKDTMNTNSICGLGYTPVTTPPPYLYFIDVTATNSPSVGVNTSCINGSTLSLLAMNGHSGVKQLRAHLKASI